MIRNLRVLAGRMDSSRDVYLVYGFAMDIVIVQAVVMNLHLVWIVIVSVLMFDFNSFKKDLK